MSNKILVLKRNASVDIEGIEEKLKAVVDNLNKVNSLAIHDDESNQKAKKLVAQSRKEWKVFDNERIEFKKAILEPYDKVDTLFKKYNKLHAEAIKKLADDTKEYEENKRVEKEKEVIEYFDSVNKHKAFVKYADTNIRVINSGTLISYKRQIDDFVNKINTDIEVIDTLEGKDFSQAVLVEYEKTLDLGQAQLAVQNRIARAEELAKLREERKTVEPVENIVAVKKDDPFPKEITEETKTLTVTVKLNHIQEIKFRNFLQSANIEYKINE